MYLYSRRTRLNSPAGVDWATTIGAKVTEITGQPVQLWGTVYSEDFGTVTWTSWFADLPSLETFGDKVQADPAFQALAAQGAEHTEGGVHDGLMQTIHGEPNPDNVAEYVSAVRAGCSGGNITRGMTAGVEIAQKAEAITGLGTMFVRNLTGPYAGVGWLTGYENIGALGAAQDALAGDASWATFLDTLEGVYLEDASLTQQTVYRKLA